MVLSLISQGLKAYQVTAKRSGWVMPMSEGYFFKVSPNRLKEVEYTLLEEGFSHTRFQFWKRGQIFGLVKKLTLIKQLHVRAFLDGTIQAEEEIWRFLMPFHLITKPAIKSACQKVREILKKYVINE